jgi:hypothetical protein
LPSTLYGCDFNINFTFDQYLSGYAWLDATNNAYVNYGTQIYDPARWTINESGVYTYYAYELFGQWYDINTDEPVVGFISLDSCELVAQCDFDAQITSTPTPTQTNTRTNAPDCDLRIQTTLTPTPTLTSTKTKTPTPTITQTLTSTTTISATLTKTPTLTPTITKTPTISSTRTSTPTLTKTPTQTPTLTPTQTLTQTLTTSPQPPDVPNSIITQPMVASVWVTGDPPLTGQAPVYYKVYYSEDNGSNWTEFVGFFNTIDPAYGFAGQISGLDYTKNYKFKVSACNLAGCGGYLVTDTTTQPKQGPEKPVVSAYKYNSGLIGDRYFISWTTPSSDMAIISYDVQMKEGSNSWVDLQTYVEENYLSGVTNYYVLPDNERQFRVRANTGGGFGPYSDPVNPSEAFDLSATNIDYTVSNVNLSGYTRTINISWTAPVGMVGFSLQNYTLLISGVGEQTINNNLNSYSYSGVTTQQDSIISLYANYSIGLIAKDYNRINGYIPAEGTGTRSWPNAPINVSISRAGIGEIKVSWSAPTYQGSTSIISYRIQYAAIYDYPNWTTIDTNNTNTNKIITGLASGIQYIFRVAATNSIGTGQYSQNVGDYGGGLPPL